MMAAAIVGVVLVVDLCSLRAKPPQRQNRLLVRLMPIKEEKV